VNSVLERAMDVARKLSPAQKIAVVRAAARSQGQGEDAKELAPASAMLWFRKMWPTHFAIEPSDYHREFADSAFAVKLEDAPDPEAKVWPRGAGKTTWCEAVTAMVGARGTRKYVLYVRRTQSRADDAVTNVAALLEASTIERYYPQHARRYINKFGKPGAWRRNRLRTHGGFTVDAIGLDTAARGVKIEDQRPDLIIFDDFDEKLDGQHITAKLLDIIKYSIIPAGAPNAWIVLVQNLITKHGVMAQLVEREGDFLHDRKLSGPIPAIRGLKWQWQPDPKTGIRRAVITAGEATWSGQSIEKCQKLIDKIGIAAFLKECQHAVKTRVEGVALHWDPSVHREVLTHEEKCAIVAMGRCFGAIDFGIWRFAFILYAVDRAGIVHRIDEYFAQRLPGQTSLGERAREIHYICQSYGIERTIPIWGDAANQTDIHEVNQAWRRGWDETYGDREARKQVEHVISKLRVLPVKQANKQRKTAIERVNQLLDSHRLKFCELPAYEWRLGMTSDNPEGVVKLGSRLEWEMENWSFPIPKPGEPQEQDADDETADGADMCAAQRYAIMSVWATLPAPATIEFGVVSDDQAEAINYERGTFMEAPHAVDILREPTRRTPSVRTPRPRFGR
jgi:hypothetical protein